MKVKTLKAIGVIGRDWKRKVRRIEENRGAEKKAKRRTCFGT